jgi:putative addiction module component (TIGR02574 family)
MISKQIANQILSLKASEKIHLVELILESLDKPDLDVQKIWAQESEKRFDAFKAGKLKSYSYEEVMKIIGK